MKKNNAFPQKLKYSHGKGPALYNDSQFDRQMISKLIRYRSKMNKIDLTNETKYLNFVILLIFLKKKNLFDFLLFI